MDPALYIPQRGQLAPVPNLHDTNNLCNTFIQPPLDGSLCTSEIYEWQAKNSPNHPVFQYLDDDGATATINFADTVQAIYRGGWILKTAVEQHVPSQERRPVVAVIALSETISYSVTVLASQRAGFVVFPISPRNSAMAVAHLLKQVSVDLVLVGKESSMQDLVSAAFEVLRSTNMVIPPTLPMLTFDDLFPVKAAEPANELPPMDYQWGDISLIIHSSGSTAFPKPVKWTFFRMLTLARLPHYGEVDFSGIRIAVHSCPMYHGMGISQICWAGGAGTTMICHKPSSPPRVSSPSEMLHEAHALKSDLLFCTPNYPEVWAKDPKEVEMLKETRGILFGGGPLDKETGDFLYGNGVNLYSAYGCTEFGMINTILPKTGHKDWEYFSFSKPANAHWVPDDTVPGTSKLILMAGKLASPAVMNCAIDGVGGFDTNDLFLPHPTEPGMWKIYGRADDQIMHSIGEKTNPGPLEAILNQDPHVAHTIMFGRGRFNAGVLVDPAPNLRFDPADEKKLAAFRNTIWPTVQRMNAYAPQHSRVFKEMILVSSPNKPFTYTAKGTPRRHAIIEHYAPEIDVLYTTVEKSTQADIPSPQSWDLNETQDFVRAVVNRVLDRSIGDSEDLFQSGCDSLQATWIRNSLLHALRSTSEADTRSVPINFVYNNPTISALAEYLATVASRQQPSEVDVSVSLKMMHDILDKYSCDFPVHVASPGAPQDTSRAEDTILITGTTGGLGCALLVQLVTMPEVQKVYAVNRKGALPLRERQKEALADKGYNTDSVINSPKVVFVEADLAQDMLGLPQHMYDEVQNSVTHIIHNAWPVNFNLNLSFFEPSIKGLRNLINLALSSTHNAPPRIVFTSSLGVLRHIDLSKPVKEDLVDASIAVGTGYSESKWVGEQLLLLASRKTPLRSISLREGQIAGSVNGAWNVHEWVPSLIKSSIHLGCLPIFSGTASWMNASSVAQAVIEARNAPSDIPLAHLAHPRPVSWQVLFEPVAQRYNLQPVSFDTWFSKLAESANAGERGAVRETDALEHQPIHNSTDLGTNPAIKLLSFFSACNDTLKALSSDSDREASLEAPALPRLDVTKCATLVAKKSLSAENLKPLSKEDMLRWIGYWERVGFLPEGRGSES